MNISLYFAGASKDEAARGLVWDDYTDAEEWLEAEGYGSEGKVYTVLVTVDRDDLKLIRKEELV